ncbi:hypothetical protein Q4S45_22925 [Massilia sp. R2A-15]|uniref:hypothetical protein n=1 Tax=Massilia sp. R2A-15 TaxID=3064278 RepID=UPI002733D37B|nr:hypothetical protein [Massilia sp. R2A-15]WLI89508.1 hypothetical protein Q4S45_22925 [Massilia sp. R2A-15]
MTEQIGKERADCPDPAPVIVAGVSYAAVPWGRARGLGQNGGIIAAQDPASGAELWTLRVYRIDYDEGREGDKQDVFIESITAQSDGTLRIVSERGDSYLVDVVRRIVIGQA